MGPIITSFLDNDLYKFSMMHAVLQKFPNVKVRYTFIDRNKKKYPHGFASTVKTQINYMKHLIMHSYEEKFLETIKYFPQSYIDFLRGYRFDPDNEVIVYLDYNDNLHVEIEGYWYRIVLWEVPILAIISECYYEETEQTPTIDIEKDIQKLREMEAHNAYFSEFGTRRRFSANVQDTIVSVFKTNGNHCFVGTSNVCLAQKYQLKAIGTMAHEWIMAHAAMFGYKLANKTALDNWADVYHGNLGIALADTYTTDVFLRSFDMKLAKLFDGVRQDSGDPYEFVDKVVAHYEKLGIDPMSKAIIFSDALNIKKACDIKEYCVGKIKSSFGIGTHLTNDVGVEPLNIVIKLSNVEVNGQWSPVVKLSDSPGKYTGDAEEIDLCKRVLKINNI
jgi:nicotinate phosphoribosyltransferase